MATGVALLAIGVLLVTSLLLRNAAARHVTAQQVPVCLQRRLLFWNRSAPVALALAWALALAGAAGVASQIATEL
jgi:hypothetical protein